jgi:pimeloyl-ACP methyl ester carboxylesterase
MSVATPLILLPGLLCDALLWQPQIVGLAGAAQCWVPDHTRHDDMAALARTILQESPFPNFALAGLSMGGYLALEIWRQAPQRVQRLALLDTTAAPESAEASALRHHHLALWREQGLAALIEATLPRSLRPAAQHDAALRASITSMALNTGYPAFARQQQAIMGRADSQALLASIDCPTLVLCGRSDVLTPPLTHQAMARALPRSTLVMVPDAGHLSSLEQPQAVTAALHSWLQA